MYIADAKRLTHEGAKDDGDRHRQGPRGQDRDLVLHRRCRRPCDRARAHGRRPLPYAALLHHQGGLRRLQQARRPRPRARSARTSTSAMRSAWRSPPARSAGPRWKAACRSWSTANASAASASAAATGQTDLRIAQAAVEVDRRELEIDATMSAIRCASPASAWAGGRTCWPTPSSARASSRSSPASRAPRTSAQPSPAKYGCRPAASYEAMLADPAIEAIINTTPNDVHLETTRAGGGGRQARLPRQADRQHRLRRPRHHRGLPQGRRGAGARLSAPAREPFPLGQAADRRRRVRQARQRRGQHQPRPARQDRSDLVALPGRRHAGRRDAADRHPLRRRAGISDGAGQGGARAVRRSWCCPATIRTSRA